MPENCVPGAIKTNFAIIAAVSRPASAVRPGVSSLLALALQAAGVAVPGPHVVLPQEEERCVGVANDRSGEGFAAAELAHYGWSPVDWARLWADDSLPADSVPDCWVPAAEGVDADEAAPGNGPPVADGVAIVDGVSIRYWKKLNWTQL